MSRTCRSCGTQVSDAARFCRGCGQQLTAPGPTDAAVAAPACQECGGELVIGARFCHTCGTEAPPPAPARIPCGACAKEIDATDAFCRHCGASTRAQPLRSAPAATAAMAGAATVIASVPPTADEVEIYDAEPAREESDARTPSQTSGGAEPGLQPTPAASPMPLMSDAEQGITAADLAGEANPNDGAASAAQSREVEAGDQDERPSAHEAVRPEAVLGPPGDDAPVAGSRQAERERAGEQAAWSDEPALNGDAVPVADDSEPQTILLSDHEVPRESPEAAEQSTIVAAVPVDVGAPTQAERICGACHAPVSKTARFCRSCGARLDEFEATVLVSRPAPSACASCGREVEPWAPFCRHCGARNAQHTPDAAPTNCELCGAPTDGSSSLCAACARVVSG